MHSIEDLHFAGRAGAGIRHVAVVDAGRERAQPARVRRRIADRVQNFHIPYVMDV